MVVNNEGKQDGIVDCGRFAIAIANCILLANNCSPSKNFDQEKMIMRQHLVDCIENLKLQGQHFNYGDDINILLMYDQMFWLHTALYN